MFSNNSLQGQLHNNNVTGEIPSYTQVKKSVTGYIQKQRQKQV